jgi:hypothetical protein
MRGPPVIACLAVAVFVWHASRQNPPPADEPTAIPATQSKSADGPQAVASQSNVPVPESQLSEAWSSIHAPISTAASFAYAAIHPGTPLPALSFAALAGTEGWKADDGDSFGGPGDPSRQMSPDTALEAGAGSLRAWSRSGLCGAIVSVARANDLPIPFFANLIWQESSFRSKTVSPAGALGIAQFMPETAVEHGLINPFEPLHALFAAGKFLRRLNNQFGNLGLAAAAYNAGPQRVHAWIAERKTLPSETRSYVVRITGRPADQWMSSEMARDPEATLMPAKAPCAEVKEAVKEQAGIVRVIKLMSELAAATAPTPIDPPQAAVAAVARATPAPHRQAGNGGRVARKIVRTERKPEPVASRLRTAEPPLPGRKRVAAR